MPYLLALKLWCDGICLGWCLVAALFVPSDSLGQLGGPVDKYLRI